MHSRRRRRSSVRRQRAQRVRFVVVTAVALGILAVLAAIVSRRPQVVLTDGPPAAALQPAKADEALAAEDETAERPVYPYSIIDGGAPTVRHLEQSIADDAVVRAHYTNFDLPRTRVVRLASARRAYVSYRMGNRVYWTRRQLTIPAGEQVLTDGQHMARTRCGNQLSETPGETSPIEPAAVALDLPLAPLRRLPTSLALELRLPPGGQGLGMPIPLATGGIGGPVVTPAGPVGGVGPTPVILPPGPDGTGSPFVPVEEPPIVTFPTIEDLPTPLPPTDPPGGGPQDPPVPPNGPQPPDPPVPVPEPGTILLVGSGAAFAALKRFRRK